MYELKKGDELEMEEKGPSILLSTKKIKEKKDISIDITGLDRTSIMQLIRGAYRKGYVKIELKFNNPVCVHYRDNSKKKVLSVINYEVNKLIGMEIIQQKEGHCIIKQLSPLSEEEFINLLRRIHMLMVDLSNDFLNALKEQDYVLMDTIVEKHDTISKFISYCLRLMNIRGTTDPDSLILYHFLSDIDIIADVYKYAARYNLKMKNHKFKPETLKYVEKIGNSLDTLYKFFYDSDIKFVEEFESERYKVFNYIVFNLDKLHPKDMFILLQMNQIYLVIFDLKITRFGLDKKLNPNKLFPQ